VRRALARLGLLLGLAVAGFATAAPPAPPPYAPYDQWAWVVVSGDDQAAHADTPTRAFDNARRDVAAGFEQRGFAAGRLAEFSAAEGGQAPKARIGPIFERLAALAQAAPGGCLVYLTSHGSPEGALVGGAILTPANAARKIAAACGARPTAIVISACFSGVFLPTLAGPDRFVLTAARRDRSSFGCGEGDRYPFFDGCVIEDLPAARDFPDLADKVRRCVAAREDAEGMRPRSQPQFFVGRDFRARARPFS
jgi:hypothetical protein